MRSVVLAMSALLVTSGASAKEPMVLDEFQLDRVTAGADGEIITYAGSSVVKVTVVTVPGGDSSTVVEQATKGVSSADGAAVTFAGSSAAPTTQNATGSGAVSGKSPSGAEPSIDVYASVFSSSALGALIEAWLAAGASPSAVLAQVVNAALAGGD